jgi:phage protein D
MTALAFGFAPSFRVRASGTALAADIAANISSISVTSAPQTLNECSFTLVNAYPKMRWTHGFEASLFDPGTSIQVEMGYPARMKKLFDGEIVSVAPDFPESGGPTVQVTARSRLHWLTLGKHTRSWQDATEADIVGQIAREAKLSSKVDPTTVKHPYVLQPNQRDLDFLLARARMIGFEVLVEAKTLIFRKAVTGGRAAVTLEWGRTLKSFRPSLDPTRQVTEVTVRGYDPKKKEAIVGKASGSSQPAGMGGKQSGSKLLSGEFGRDAADVEICPPPASQQEADARAKARLGEITRDTVVGEGSCVGLPELVSGGVVDLKGLGPKFSGTYYVTRAVHSIGGGGYDTSFSVSRSAVG